MAWDLTLVTMVRSLIGDTGEDQRYDDDRIKQAVMTAGLIVSQEYPFSVAYTFDFLVANITPDPTEPATLDNVAVALIGLKAACILSLNDYQTAVGTGIRVRDGDSEVDTTGSFKGYADILKNGPCAAYTSLLKSLLTKRGMSQGRAIIGPHSGPGSPYGVRGPNGIWHIRSFYDSWLRW